PSQRGHGIPRSPWQAEFPARRAVSKQAATRRPSASASRSRPQAKWLCGYAAPRNQIAALPVVVRFIDGTAVTPVEHLGAESYGLGTSRSYHQDAGAD